MKRGAVAKEVAKKIAGAAIVATEATGGIFRTEEYRDPGMGWKGRNIFVNNPRHPMDRNQTIGRGESAGSSCARFSGRLPSTDP